MQWILNVDDDDDDSVQPGDMLFIPELVTGAGELEGVRFVGTRKEGGGYELLGAGIESPMFPPAIANDKSPHDLRQHYESLLDVVLQEQGGFSMADLFGGADVVEEFWASPDVERRLKETEGEWHIPLNQCKILSTHSSSSGTS